MPHTSSARENGKLKIATSAPFGKENSVEVTFPQRAGKKIRLKLPSRNVREGKFG